MKNLESLERMGVQGMNPTEMKQVEGGFVCGGLCIFGAVVLAGMAGAAVGYGICALID